MERSSPIPCPFPKAHAVHSSICALPNSKRRFVRLDTPVVCPRIAQVWMKLRPEMLPGTVGPANRVSRENGTSAAWGHKEARFTDFWTSRILDDR
jgi:hypothetical protein